MALSIPTSTRRWILVGFALVALSGIVQFFQNVRSGIFGQGDFRFVLEVVLQPFSGVFAAAGWWFLSQLEATDARQRQLISRGFAVLGAQFASLAAATLCYFWSVDFSSSLQWASWIDMIGCAVTAAGLLATSVLVRGASLARDPTLASPRP